MNCIDTVFQTLQSQVFSQDITRRSFLGTVPCLPIITSHITVHVNTVFAYWKQSNLDGSEGLGTRLYLYITKFAVDKFSCISQVGLHLRN